MLHAGKVYIVGAGPGAADLISLRARRALMLADAVLADRLLPRDFLEQIGVPTAGKHVRWLADTHPRWSQSQINQWLADEAQAGKVVVRLKGGDPFVFGRGDSEIEYLSGRGIACEVIPGISASTGVPGAAGLPLTRHALGESFAVATAQVVGGAVQQTFPRADSLVILMGAGVLGQLVARLLADGWPQETPAAVIERGTLPWERRVFGPLAEIHLLADDAQLSAPASLVVGDAAAAIASLRRRPMVLFTGLEPGEFQWLGNLLHWPALQLVPDAEGLRLLPSVLARLEGRALGWVAFTDRLAVESFMRALWERGRDARTLAGARLAALSRPAAVRLGEHGLRADAVVEGEDVARVLDATARRAVLVVHGTHVSRQLSARLEQAGIAAMQLSLQTVAANPELGRPLPPHDAIYFVSPSGVHAYWSTYGPAAFQRPAWCLGEAVRDALAEHGIEGTVVAQPLECSDLSPLSGR